MSRPALALPLVTMLAACSPFGWEHTGPNPAYRRDGGGGGGGCTPTSCGGLTPLCSPSGACVECLSSDQCEAKHLGCGAGGHCAACAANADCTSGLCLAGGACADRADQVYVDSKRCVAGMETGAYEHPYCHVQAGLDAVAAVAITGKAKTLVVFAGSGYAESLTANTDKGDYVADAVGIGSPRVAPKSGPLLSLTGAKPHRVALGLDGFAFDGSAGANDGIKCSGDNGASDYNSAVLTLRRSTVNGSPTIGVAATNQCSLILDADTIGNNRGGGVSISASAAKLTNLLIVGNGSNTSNQGGINIGSEIGSSGAAVISLANLTVLSNQKRTGALASGIDCLAPVMSLINTVVFDNHGSISNELTVPDCNASYSAFVGAGSNSAHNLDIATCKESDLFVMPPGDLHPQPTGEWPCILASQGTPTGAPDHDLVSAPRTVADIGCYSAAR